MKRFVIFIFACVLAITTGRAATLDVQIAGFAFQPIELFIVVGDTVRWTNNDASPHTATATNGEFDSGNLNNGQSFAHVFTAAATIPYVCLYHSNMSGVISVTRVPMLHDVSIANFTFSPAELSIMAGDTVRWTNNDTSPHTVTATNGEFDSGNLNNGQMFMHVFSFDGSFPYVCLYHSNMTGMITVGTPGGGLSDWVELPSPTSLPLNDVRFWNENLGWAAGDQGLFRTTDGGETWLMSSSGEDMEAVYFVSETEGWASGNDGLIVHSTNGGESWQPQTSGVAEKLRDIWFADAQNGWSGGRDGLLVHTTNGGQNWSPQSSPAGDDIRGFHMLDSQRGWMVASDGLIMHTTNGGTNWITQLSVPGGEEDEFEAVFAWDENLAWAAGGQGRVYHTTNSGQSWVPQTSGTTVALMDIFFTSPDTGWVAGAGGFIANTYDGGMMWHQQTPPAFASFNAFYFVHAELGFMVSGDGRIFKYAPTQTGTDPNERGVIPQTIRLIGNYPNPFNPSTAIEFEISVAGQARLDVFTILGGYVTTLMDKPVSPGTHVVKFDAAGYSSGLYVYRLFFGGHTAARTMILLK